MTQKQAYSLHKRRYAQISTKKRLAIVRMVENERRSFSEVGRKLHVNASTVRLIIKKYNQTGTIFIKRLRNAPKSPTSSVCQQEDSPEPMIKKKQNGHPESPLKQQAMIKVEYVQNNQNSIALEIKVEQMSLYYRY